MEKLLVTDTHPLVYFFCEGGKRLGKAARRAFEEAVTNSPTIIFVPAPVLWEMSTFVDSGKVKLVKSFAAWIDDLFAYPMMNPWPYDHETIKLYHDVRYHNDPFGRAIVASALQLGLPLISNDAMMHKMQPCKLVWD